LELISTKEIQKTKERTRILGTVYVLVYFYNSLCFGKLEHTYRKIFDFCDRMH